MPSYARPPAFERRLGGGYAECVADRDLSLAETRASAAPHESLRCSFCGKDRNEVQAMVAGWTPSLAICNECVDLCAEIIAEQRPPHHRPPGRAP